jgi:hypothetical protein
LLVKNVIEKGPNGRARCRALRRSLATVEKVISDSVVLPDCNSAASIVMIKFGGHVYCGRCNPA